jgi:hypothetical protein
MHEAADELLLELLLLEELLLDELLEELELLELEELPVELPLPPHAATSAAVPPASSQLKAWRRWRICASIIMRSNWRPWW